MTYLQLGWYHILSLEAIDHLLFLLLLILPLYEIRLWSLVKLITAFTIGHAITIFIALGELPASLIYLTELLIPITIIIAGLKSIVIKKKIEVISPSNYILVGVFGLIHGLGFAASIKGMMMGEESVVFPLMQFNIGVELGQILVLLIIVFCMKWLHGCAMKRDANQTLELLKQGIAFVGILMAIWMVWERM